MWTLWFFGPSAGPWSQVRLYRPTAEYGEAPDTLGDVMTQKNLVFSLLFVGWFLLPVLGKAGPLEGEENRLLWQDDTSLRAIRPLAEQGEVSAQYLLGLKFDLGEGVSQDYREAGVWFKRAAVQGHTRAQASLGLLFYLGRGVPQNYAQAAWWFRQAADRGEASAQYYLGILYKRGQGGIRQDGVQAEEWFRKAAAQGNLGAQVQLDSRHTP